MPEKTLLVITGPTGVGKTEVAIQLALAAGTEIVSADSRQLFRDIPIGTAAPTSEELALVKHQEYFLLISRVKTIMKKWFKNLMPK